MLDLYDKISELREEYTDDQILDMFDELDVISYIKKSRLFKFCLAKCINNNDDVILLLKSIMEYLYPYYPLTKEEMKKELCDFIDCWYN